MSKLTLDRSNKYVYCGIFLTRNGLGINLKTVSYMVLYWMTSYITMTTRRLFDAMHDNT